MASKRTRKSKTPTPVDTTNPFFAPKSAEESAAVFAELTAEEITELQSFIPADELAEMDIVTTSAATDPTEVIVLGPGDYTSMFGIENAEPSMPEDDATETCEIVHSENALETGGAASGASASFFPETEVVADTTESAELAAIAAAMLIYEAPENESSPTLPVASTPSDPQSQSWDEILTALPLDQVKETQMAVVMAIDDRAAFEADKDPDNTNIQRTLKKLRGMMTVDRRAAQVMVATNVDPQVINRVFHDGSRYNVYAIGKLADVIHGLTKSDSGQSGALTNAINLACMKSLFRFRAAGLTFTGELAKAAASCNIRVDAAIRDHLVRHTVSPSTAPTQASSTMQALTTLGIVRKSGSHRNPNYELADGPVVRKLEELLAAA